MERAILAIKNEYDNKLNKNVIKYFQREKVVYFSFDSVTNYTSNLYQVKFLNSLTLNGLLTHRHIIKEKCPIMLLRNLHPSNDLYNGIRMICKLFKNNIIIAQISIRQFYKKIIMIPRISLCTSNDEALPFKFKRN
ncbi:hypothetical protein KFK09_019197 [Dendrobium nobile]|uniref:DNA helicase Pif1-like 2B domain-containing protein n=1 Tax=Dendrobium nobile TaxID=94219 RepID=A0A8T3AXE8_DENNO|nr:hypothetical protein KFK09_019197 [Dendrobium nobile]